MNSVLNSVFEFSFEFSILNSVFEFSQQIYDYIQWFALLGFRS